MKIIITMLSFWSLSIFAFSDYDKALFIDDKNQIEALLREHTITFSDSRLNFCELAEEITPMLLSEKQPINTIQEKVLDIIRKGQGPAFIKALLAINDNTKKTISQYTISPDPKRREKIANDFSVHMTKYKLNKTVKYVLAFYYFNEFNSQTALSCADASIQRFIGKNNMLAYLSRTPAKKIDREISEEELYHIIGGENAENSSYWSNHLFDASANNCEYLAGAKYSSEHNYALENAIDEQLQAFEQHFDRN